MPHTLGADHPKVRTTLGDNPDRSSTTWGVGDAAILREWPIVTKPRIPNVLAARYASTDLVTIWSPEEKVRSERRLWLAVLTAQRDLGIDLPDGVLEAYAAAVDDVDLASIAEREKVTRHDVKARI
jgi:hypothetical protein